MCFFANIRTLLNVCKCKALGDFLVSFLEIVISKGSLGGISQNSIFRNWFEIVDIVLHRLLKRLISSSATSTKRLVAIKKKPLGALITSSATNQRIEFSVINYAILLIIDMATRGKYDKRRQYLFETRNDTLYRVDHPSPLFQWWKNDQLQLEHGLTINVGGRGGTNLNFILSEIVGISLVTYAWRDNLRGSQL